LQSAALGRIPGADGKGFEEHGGDAEGLGGFGGSVGGGGVGLWAGRDDEI
jgi:hypothetical protein